MFEWAKQNIFSLSVDQIYHLASPASPPNYMYNPVKTLKTNTVGTLNMLGLAKRCRARLLLASTSEVYGGKFVQSLVVITFTLIKSKSEIV